MKFSKKLSSYAEFSPRGRRALIALDIGIALLAGLIIILSVQVLRTPKVDATAVKAGAAAPY